MKIRLVWGLSGNLSFDYILWVNMSCLSRDRAFFGGYPRGRLELIIGPMFSGKTSELLRRIRRFGYAKMKTLLVKFAAVRAPKNLRVFSFCHIRFPTQNSLPSRTQDQRYSTSCVSTHDKIMIEAVSANKLSEMSEFIPFFLSMQLSRISRIFHR